MFERMLAIYGVQRMTAAWGDVPADERHAVWGSAIGRAIWSQSRGTYDLESVGAALEELAADPKGWPPSSGEFADRCERFAQRPGRNTLALPVPKRSADELERGRQHMDAIKALLTKRITRDTGSSREPGSDDEPLPPPAACRCWVGLTRSETLCESCASFRRNRARLSTLVDGTAQQLADDEQRAA